MTSSADPFATGSFALPAADAAQLARRQGGWVSLGVLVGALALLTGAPPSPMLSTVALGVAVGVGAAAVGGRPPVQAMPSIVAVVLVGAAATELGLASTLGVGLGAGLVVGSGRLLPRIEAALAGVAGAGVGGWIAEQLALAPLPAALVFVGLVSWGASQALLPGALAFRARGRIPSPGRIRATLAEAYRPACMRAWQLDGELAPAAPDREAREGVREVAGWVYRLALTLQTLDADVARIDPADVAARRLALADDATDDAFVLDRRASTDRHLARMLEHRDALTTERLRTAALQDYALAWLEEARAGLAVAREQPGETPPERLDQVLDKLRGHAADRDARRAAERELRAR